MPKFPQHLAATPVPTLHQQYIAVINSSTDHIFSLNPDMLSLTEYYWYIAILIHLIIGVVATTLFQMAWVISGSHRDMSQAMKEMDFFHFFQSIWRDAAHFFHFFEGVGALKSFMSFILSFF